MFQAAGRASSHRRSVAKACSPTTSGALSRSMMSSTSCSPASSSPAYLSPIPDAVRTRVTIVDLCVMR
jgi:hypothetical protein